MDSVYNHRLNKKQKEKFLEIFEFKLKKNNKKRYSVFVGGIEVNDYDMKKQEAMDLVDEYINDGYDDVEMVRI
jgi:hypothetical protein